MISISSFQPGQATAVAELITNIQQKEFGVPITLADQPDLLDINGFYFQKNGHFWCAIDGQGEVIGTIALLNSGDGHGTIRKMFVRKDFRGKAHNIAKPLLDTLEQWAMANGITHLSLGTREDLAAARHFYLKNAYQVIAAPDLPALFPRMAVDNLFFQKKLQKPDPLLEAVSIERCTDAPTFLECATMMAATPPWQTRGLAYCLDAVNGDFKETYILRDGSELLGFAVLQMSGAFSGYVQTICITDRLRGKGFGSRLLSHCEERIFQVSPNVFLCVSSFNTKAYQLYVNMGYTMVGRLPDFLVEGEAEILLRKTIGAISG